MIAGEGDAPRECPAAGRHLPERNDQVGEAQHRAEIPVWDEALCIQCGKCVLVCPHAVIRAKVVRPEALADAPIGFKTAAARWREFPDALFTLQVAPEDCTGCSLCVECARPRARARCVTRPST